MCFWFRVHPLQRADRTSPTNRIRAGLETAAHLVREPRGPLLERPESFVAHRMQGATGKSFFLPYQDTQHTPSPEGEEEKRQNVFVTMRSLAADRSSHTRHARLCGKVPSLSLSARLINLAIVCLFEERSEKRKIQEGCSSRISGRGKGGRVVCGNGVG